MQRRLGCICVLLAGLAMSSCKTVAYKLAPANVEGSLPVQIRTILVDDFGADPTGVRDSTAAIVAAIASVPDNDDGLPTEVRFSRGSYQLSCAGVTGSICLKVENKRKLTLAGDAAGSELMVANAQLIALGIQNSANIGVNHLRIGYSEVWFTQGRIKAVNNVEPKSTKPAVSFDVDLDDGFPLPTDYCANLNKDVKDPTRVVVPGTVVDVSRRGLKAGAWDSLNLYRCEDLGDRHWRFETNPMWKSVLAVGDGFVQKFGVKLAAFQALHVDNIAVNDLTIYASPGVATGWMNNTGNVMIDGLHVGFRPNSTALMSSNADGIHARDNWAAFTIQNSSFEGMGDDAVNIYSSPAVVKQMVGADLKTSVSAVHKDDLIQVVDPVRGEIRFTAKVTALQIVGDEQTLTLGNLSAAKLAQEKDLVFNISAAAPGTLIQKNTFGGFRGSSIKDSSFNSVIANNTFTDIDRGAIALRTWLGSWREGPLVENVTIKDNTFSGGRDMVNDPLDGHVIWIASETSTGTQGASGPSHIRLENNSFTNAQGYPISVHAGSYLTIVGTKVDADISTPRPTPGGIIELSFQVDNAQIEAPTVNDPRSATQQPWVQPLPAAVPLQ